MFRLSIRCVDLLHTSLHKGADSQQLLVSLHSATDSGRLPASFYTGIDNHNMFASSYVGIDSDLCRVLVFDIQGQTNSLFSYFNPPRVQVCMASISVLILSTSFPN